MSTKALREQRAGFVAQANQILVDAQRERRNLTGEQSQRFNALHAEVTRLKREIDDAELLAPVSLGGTRQSALRSWLVAGSLADRHDDADFRRLGFNPNTATALVSLQRKAPKTGAEARALTTTTISSGAGLSADTGFIAGIEAAQLAYGPVRRYATIARTDSGGDAFVPTADDTSTEGEIIKDGVTFSEGYSTFGLKRLGAFLYSSKIVRLSWAAFRDGFDVEHFLGRQLGERLARVQGRHFTSGSGANEPTGILTAATDSGVTTAQTAGISWAELMALKYSVDPAHRESGKFMAHDSTVKLLKQMTNTTGQPVFQVGLEIGAPDTIDGDELVINQNMPTFAASAKAVLYGDLSKYLIREVANLDIAKFVERWAELGQIGFQLSSRVDGALLDAGSHPVKYLTIHS